LLCYVTGISRFISILEVVSEPYRDTTLIWSDEEFPCRLKVKPIIELTFETAVPVHDLKDSFSCFQNLKNPNSWTGAFRGSPAKWPAADGEAVVKAIHEAKENTIKRPYAEKKLKYRPKAIKAKISSVTIPDTILKPFKTKKVPIYGLTGDQ